MKTALSGESAEMFEDGVIQSLCYLHQETLKENRKELAGIIQTAIEQSVHVIPASVSLSRDSNDLLQQFYLLRRFQALDAIQKELFIRKIESIETGELRFPIGD
jgi:hypothetical protein